MGLSLVSQARKLPPALLEDILLKTVVIKGLTALASILFFSFETLSCILRVPYEKENGAASNLCVEAASGAGYLSMFVALFLLRSLGHETVLPTDRICITYQEVAAGDLTWTRKIIMSLHAVTGLTSLFLFTTLGVMVPDEDLSATFWVGLVGLMALVTALVVEIWVDVLKGGEKASKSSTSSRKFSSGDVTKGVMVAGMI